MKRLVKVVFANSKILFKDRLFVISMLLFPLLLGVIYSSAAKSYTDDFVRTAFVDYDKSTVSNEIIKLLNEHQDIKTHKASITEAKDMLESGKVEAVFVLEKGFQHSLESGSPTSSFKIITLPSSFSGEFLSEILASDVSTISSKYLTVTLVLNKYKELGIENNDLKEKTESYYMSFIGKNPLMKVNYELLNTSHGVPKFTKVINPLGNTSSGGLLVFIMFFLMFGSGWIIEIRENGTLKRLKSINDGFVLSFLGTFFCLFFAGVLQAAAYILAGSTIGMPVIHTPLSFAVLLLFIFTISSMSMFFASVFKSASQLQAFIPIFIILTSFAGSCFYDMTLISKRFATISLFTPQGITLNTLNAISSGHNTPDWILMPLLLLIISGFLIFFSYLISSRTE